MSDSPPLSHFDTIAPAEAVFDLKKRRKLAAADPLKLDRLPPHSLEAEQGVLGCILLSPAICIPQAIEGFAGCPEPFYDLRHQAIYSAIVAMFDQRSAIDEISLMQKLKDANQLEGIGGMSYLMGLADVVPSAANSPEYLTIVREKWIARQMISVCTRAVSHMFDAGNASEMPEIVANDILKIGKETRQTKQKTIKELVGIVIEEIDQRIKFPDRMVGLETGFPDFDRKTGGLLPKDLIIIAARPSVGKTSFAMNIAEHVAVNNGLPVGIFSIEMTAESLVKRMMYSRARVNARTLQTGLNSERDCPKLTGVAGAIAKAPLFIDDTAGLSLLQLSAKARRMVEQHGIRLLVVDHFGLMVGNGRRQQSSQERAEENSKGLKQLAKELGIPVILLVQLNRDVEKRGPGERPRLSDLRETGSLEQDGDLIGFLFNEKPDHEADKLAVTLYIAKQRNGPTGDVNLIFFKQFTRFESAAKISDNDIPEEQNLPYAD